MINRLLVNDLFKFKLPIPPPLLTSSCQVSSFDPGIFKWSFTLQWRHNDHDGVSNHQSPGCLLNRLFGRRSKKTWMLCVTGLCAGNSPGPVNSPHKWPVTRKIFPLDDVIMDKWFSKIALRRVWLVPVDADSTWVQVWLGAIMQQAITLANVESDLCRHTASLATMS